MEKVKGSTPLLSGICIQVSKLPEICNHHPSGSGFMLETHSLPPDIQKILVVLILRCFQ